MRLRALALVTALSLVASCGDDDITAPQLPVTFSGTISIQNGTTVPANARVLVLWGVSAGSPDYSYVFGSGTLGANGTFTITFNENPPAAALNQNMVGVGLVILTTDQTLGEGQVPANYTFPGLIGMSEDHSIIFTQNLTAELAADFFGRFNGYGLGEVERSTTTFDSFKCVARDALKLIVDDVANLRPPNWT